MHLVLYFQLSRALANISLDKWSYLAGPELTEGVVEHSEVQSMRGNPNARRQLRDLKEGAPYPPNHRGASSTSHPPQGKQPTRDSIRDLRLRGALPGSPCQRLRGIMPHNYSLTHYCSEPGITARHTPSWTCCKPLQTTPSGTQWLAQNKRKICTHC